MTESTKTKRRAAPDATHTPRSATEAAIFRRAKIDGTRAWRLEQFFAEHESAMGARSTLLGTIQQLQAGGPPENGSGRNGVEKAMVGRVQRIESLIVPVAKALAQISPWHREVLYYAHGVPYEHLPSQPRVHFGIATLIVARMPDLVGEHAAARAAGKDGDTNVPAEPSRWLEKVAASSDEVTIARLGEMAEAHLAAAHAAFAAVGGGEPPETAKQREQREQAERDRKAAERQRRHDARKARQRATMARVEAAILPRGDA